MNRSEFIRFCVDSGVLKFGEFRLKSGRRAPYFLNFGNFVDGKSLENLGNFYADAFEENSIDCESLFGPAYKGIPLCVTLASSLARRNKNFFYSFNRKEEKDHGEGGTLVGKLTGKVCIVDDVVTDTF